MSEREVLLNVELNSEEKREWLRRNTYCRPATDPIEKSDFF